MIVCMHEHNSLLVRFLQEWFQLVGSATGPGRICIKIASTRVLYSSGICLNVPRVKAGQKLM
jgi:hypothetical protein